VKTLAEKNKIKKTTIDKSKIIGSEKDSSLDEPAEPFSEKKENAQNLSNQGKNEKRIEKIVRVPSGIKGLDELIQGGFEQGSAVLVTGAAGTGKTTFCLQFLYYGATKLKEPGVFITFEEARESLYRHTLEFGWDFEALEKKGLFQVLEYKPHQVNKIMEEGGGQIRDAIKSMGAKRLAVDSITAYSLLFRDDYKKRESTLDFFELLKKWGCTSMIISEMPPKIAEIKEAGVGFLTDAVISLYYSKKEDKDIRVHSLEILKMRGTKHTNKVCALTFENNGIVVYPDIEIF
jgi:KaiC/GvpD/RAD55 family RecA-like ATPase